MKSLVAFSNNYTEDSRELSISLSNFEHLESIRLTKWSVPDYLVDDINAAYGEDVFVERVAAQCGFALIKPQEDWLVILPERYTKRKVDLSTLGELELHKRSFVKCVDFKFFKAGIFQEKNEIPGYSDIDSSILVLKQEIVEWELEVRCFVKRRKILTYSSYLRNGEINKNYQLNHVEKLGFERFTREFLDNNQIEIPEAIVLDFGIMKGKGWAFIEANSAWASGIYNCDAEKVIEVVLASCKKSTSA